MSENNSKFNIKYVNANICDVYYRLAEFFLLRFYHLLTNFTLTGFNEHESQATNETLFLFLLLCFILPFPILAAGADP